jgi:hypothetical protein
MEHTVQLQITRRKSEGKVHLVGTTKQAELFQ